MSQCYMDGSPECTCVACRRSRPDFIIGTTHTLAASTHAGAVTVTTSFVSGDHAKTWDVLPLRSGPLRVIRDDYHVDIDPMAFYLLTGITVGDIQRAVINRAEGSPA